MTREEEITKNMRLLKISRAEAEQLYIDDHTDAILPEVAEMEKKAKQCGRRYEGDTTARKKRNKTPVLDGEKVDIIQSIAGNLSQLKFSDEREITNITIINAQKEITFNISDREYSVSLIKHRVKK